MRFGKTRAWRRFSTDMPGLLRSLRDAGLGVNAGHDLSLENLGRFCSIPGVLEVSIGHALIGEALETGLANTVEAYLEILAKT